MRNRILLSSLVVAAALLTGCGGGSSSSGAEASDGQSNIPYLREHHANYKDYGSGQTPAPIKDPNAKSITWTIAASSEEGAQKLADHINYMEQQLKADQNPRAFDKLFLMEAYMKFHGYYTTSVEKSGTNVVVSKNAKSECAYKVISAHSDAVSGDFFAQGVTNKDYSSIAEGILASSACDDVRAPLEDYIASRQRGM